MRRLATIVVTMAAAAWLCSPQAGKGQAVPSKEYQLKAAYLYNFTKFIEWPAAAFADNNDPIVIGIYGSNPFGTELSKAVEGRKVNGRSVVIKPVPTASEAQQVHVLFAGGEVREEQIKSMLATVRGKPVLTVGETRRFGTNGGIVVFKLEDDKVKFDMEVEAATAAGLRVSAQLQDIVKRGRMKGRK